MNSGDVQVSDEQKRRLLMAFGFAEVVRRRRTGNSHKVTKKHRKQAEAINKADQTDMHLSNPPHVFKEEFRLTRHIFDFVCSGIRSKVETYDK